MKKNQIKAIRGMNDLLPSESGLWLRVEAACRDVFENFGYRQIRTPVVESTHLFARSIGADTDIVAKEMYSFEDRNGDSLTLRPEGTASCVRAGIEHGLFYNQQQRLWYNEPMFRHERPQKGRYRQFRQMGVEAYGWPGVDIEAEVLSIVQRVFSRLGLDKTQLQINSLGDTQARADYRNALVAYLGDFKDQLDDDSQRRLTTNPLRILDSKNPAMQELLENAPSILDYLSDESKANFDQLKSHLNGLNIEFTVNPRLVRGLDYYNDTVFEWVNADYGAQSTVCAGGRYDTMVEQLGGHATPAFGFGMGVERLVQVLQEQSAPITQISDTASVYIVSVGTPARQQALLIQQALTQEGVSVLCHCGEGSMKNQFKKADKSGAAVAVVIGEEEANGNQASVKMLRRAESERSRDKLAAILGDDVQKTIVQNDVPKLVTNLLESL